MADAGSLIGLICTTFHQLQNLAPVVALLWIAGWLLLALAFGGGAPRVISAFVAVVFGLVILSLPAILGALGASGGCS